MTERGRGSVRRTATTLSIGPSRLAWDGEALDIDVDEIAAPLPRRIRGRIRVKPAAVLREVHDLDGAGRHLWRPIGPRSEVEVTLTQPGVSWRGGGYFDWNAGVEPLQDRFAEWTWSRVHLPKETRLFYDVTLLGGEQRGLALVMDDAGGVERTTARDFVALPSTLWRAPRAVRPLGDAAPMLVRTLEDAPFYSRSILRDTLNGETARDRP